MTDVTQVLIVEDEDDIRNLVAINLKRAGFQVLAAPDGTTGLRLAREHTPPVVLLDRMLPDLPGSEVCRQLRADPSTNRAYVLMLTALGEEEDRIEGFEVGADDYVTKPFSVRELVLRVQAAARRVQAPPPADGDGGEVRFGDVRIDTGAHRAWVGEVEMDLTSTEYKLLVYLSENAGRLCERGALLQDVWELPPTLNTRTVDTLSLIHI